MPFSTKSLSLSPVFCLLTLGITYQLLLVVRMLGNRKLRELCGQKNHAKNLLYKKISILQKY